MHKGKWGKAGLYNYVVRCFQKLSLCGFLEFQIILLWVNDHCIDCVYLELIE